MTPPTTKVLFIQLQYSPRPSLSDLNITLQARLQAYDLVIRTSFH
jgi:hypothetical protein